MVYSLLMGLTTYLYKAYNDSPFTKYNGHASMDQNLICLMFFACFTLDFSLGGQWIYAKKCLSRRDSFFSDLDLRHFVSSHSLRCLGKKNVGRYTIHGWNSLHVSGSKLQRPFPAGWSPQMMVKRKGSVPPNPLNSVLGSLVFCHNLPRLFQAAKHHLKFSHQFVPIVLAVLQLPMTFLSSSPQRVYLPGFS